MDKEKALIIFFIVIIVFLALGVLSAHNNGYKQGYKEGYDNAYDIGYEDGYTSCLGEYEGLYE